MPSNLTASVAVVRVSTVTYSVPAAAIEYIELLASAYLDSSGRYRFFDDIVLMVDAKSIVFSKPLSDLQPVFDLPQKEPRKAVADQAALSDAKAFAFSKAVSDQAVMLDPMARQVAKILADSFATSDSPAKTASKALASAFGLTDAQTVQAQKLIADSVSFVEAVSAVRTFVRAFSDSIAPLEVVAKTLVKPPFVEQISVADARDVLPLKNLSDAVAIDDGAAIGDGSTYFFEKYLNNVAFTGDSDAFFLSKAASEQFGLSDSGQIVSQGYCDITYFAGDYVGISSSF